MVKTLPSPLPGCLFPRCLLPLNQGRVWAEIWMEKLCQSEMLAEWKLPPQNSLGFPMKERSTLATGWIWWGISRAPTSNSQKMDMKQRHILTQFCRSEGALLVRLRNIPTDEIPIWSQGTPVQPALLEPQISRTTKWQQSHSVLPPHPKAEKWYNQKQASSYHLNFMAVYTCVLCHSKEKNYCLER